MAGHDGQESSQQASRGGGQGNRARAGSRRVTQWARDYVRLPGIPDEYIAPDGTPRAVWTRFFEAFGALAPDEIERRFGAADRHLREAGVTYRAPGETSDRLWPLSHLPLLLDEAEWQQIDRRHHAARAIAGTGSARSLWRGSIGGRGRDSRRSHRWQLRISAVGLRHRTAGRPISQSVCRRCRPRARWTLVDPGRPHPGAIGNGLRAGKPAGFVARLCGALQVDECRAGRAVFRSLPRQSARRVPTATSRGSDC